MSTTRKAIIRTIAITAISAVAIFSWRANIGTIKNVTKRTTKTRIRSRSLVILMGNLRGGERAWESMYSNVLRQDSGPADLALLVMDNFGPYPNATLLERAKYVWTFPDYDDWGDAVDLVNGTAWRTTHLPKFRIAEEKTSAVERYDATILFGPLKIHENLIGEWKEVHRFKGSAILIFMLRWFLVQRILENGILDKYDRFVVTRTDHYYLCHHDFSSLDLSNNTIWIPEGEEYLGYTDRHLVVGRENLLDSLDVIPQLIEKPFEYNFWKHANSEVFLKSVWLLKNLNVKKFPRVMFVAATRSDPSSIFLEAVPSEFDPDVLVKYPSEWEKAQKCLLQEYAVRP